MKKPFAFVSLPRAAGVLPDAAVGIPVSAHGHGWRWGLLAAVGLACALAASPVLAEQCPRGQIFWKTKKTCVDKAEAAKLGFYHGPIPAKPADKPAGDKPAGDQPAAEPAAAAPADQPPAADAVVAPPAPVPAPEPEPVAAQVETPKPSPFGELTLEDFAKAK
ncbi:hypothetical protein [Rhodoblastus sp.]|uniref:hypothetical protein n=1 Tax=Rhodoblastus sp. TaxID=1962975 RepID=UPI0035AE387E